MWLACVSVCKTTICVSYIWALYLTIQSYTIGVHILFCVLRSWNERKVPCAKAVSNICLYITYMVGTLDRQLSPHSVSLHILYAHQAFGSIHCPHIICSGQKFSHRKLCRISSRPFKLHITEYICSIIYVLLDVPCRKIRAANWPRRPTHLHTNPSTKLLQQ